MRVLTGAVLLACVAPLAQAAEMARVVDKVQIVREQPVSQQVCQTEDVQVPAQRSGAGAVVGGIAGGLLGNTVGRGGGNAAATVIGAVTGAIVGDRIDNADRRPSVQSVQRCSTERTMQDVVVGYRVTYEYAGRRYTTRLAQDPGDQLPVTVTASGVVPAADQVDVLPARRTTTVVEEQPPVIYEQSPQVVYAAPQVVYASPPPVYWGPPAYWGPAVSIGLHFGFGGHAHGHRW